VVILLSILLKWKVSVVSHVILQDNGHERKEFHGASDDMSIVVEILRFWQTHRAERTV